MEKDRNIALEFDGLREDYTAKISRWVPHYRNLLEGMTKYLPQDLRPLRILDLGCGNGNVTALLLSKFPTADYTLVDVSSEMLRECRQRFAERNNVEYREAFFQELDFPAAEIDLVVAGLSLHHLKGEEKQVFFKAIYRWLAPGACFSCSDLFVDRHNTAYHHWLVEEWRRYAFHMGTTDEEWAWIMEHYSTYDHPNGFSDQIRWLRAAGFHQVRISWRRTAWGNICAVKAAQD